MTCTPSTRHHVEDDASDRNSTGLHMARAARPHARRRRAAGHADCSASTRCWCAACYSLALWMGVNEHGVFSAGWFRLACTCRTGRDVAGEGACCPTSRCAACGCLCCWCFCDIVGTGGASSDPGGLAKDGQLEADRHTFMAFLAPHVTSKCDLLPHPPAFQPHFNSCQTALPSALHTLQNPSICTTTFLLTIANASQLENRIVSQHTTTHRDLSMCQDLFCLCLPACPSL